MEAFAQQAAVALENARLYESMQRVNEKLREALRLREEMIQNVSHELRTPLALIRGYVELLLEGMLGSLEKPQREAVAVLHRQAERLHYMVNRLLTLQTLEAGSLRKRPVDVEVLLRETTFVWEDQAREKGIQLQVEVAEGLPPVMADPELLGQVITNLVDNAIKFSVEAGTVRVQAWREGDQMRIAVSDQGIGIPPDRLKRVFERFYQVDGSSTRRFGGMGIGLTLCQTIVEMHEGRIWAESAGEGKGSTFHVALPLAGVEAPS